MIGLKPGRRLCSEWATIACQGRRSYCFNVTLQPSAVPSLSHAINIETDSSHSFALDQSMSIIMSIRIKNLERRQHASVPCLKAWMPLQIHYGYHGKQSR